MNPHTYHLTMTALVYAILLAPCALVAWAGWCWRKRAERRRVLSPPPANPYPRAVLESTPVEDGSAQIMDLDCGHTIVRFTPFRAVRSRCPICDRPTWDGKREGS